MTNAGLNEDEVEVRGPPEAGTEPLLEYFWSSTSDYGLFHLVVDTVLTSDYTAYVARKVLDGETNYKDLEPSQLAVEKPGPRTKALRRSRQELLEMFLSRAVDNFQLYLVEIIRDVLKRRPEILSATRKELTLGYIIQFETIQELITDLVESRVSNLSYEGFDELQEWCEKKGIPLLVPEGQQDAIKQLIALRNVIVHNRGRVDARYLSATGDQDLRLGDKKALEADDLFVGLDLLNRVVVLSDAAIAGKFGLKQLAVRDELSARAKARYAKADESTDEPANGRVGLPEGDPVKMVQPEDK